MADDAWHPYREPRVFDRLKQAAWLVLAMCSAGALAPGAAAGEGFFDRPEGQGVASLVVPGSGQFLQSNRVAGGLYLGAFATSLAAANYYRNQDDFLDADDRFDDDLEIQFYNASTLGYDIFILVAADIAMFSGYAAYRDGRLENDNKGFSTPAPHETFSDLALAPFQIDYLLRPTTYIPLLLVGAALSQTESGDPNDGLYEIRYADDVNTTVLGLYHTVGIGMGPAVAEEALFRGFLNNHFSHLYGRYGGLALSSALFALGHLGEGNQADALTAGVFGAYVGLLQQRNGYAIGEGVAIHFWSNFLAGLTALQHGGPAENLLTFAFSF
jgi:membrane protease YdiL (CAAX protease family)